jgi:hypothetical protein
MTQRHLDNGLANIFHRGSDCKYFRLLGPRNKIKIILQILTDEEEKQQKFPQSFS